MGLFDLPAPLFGIIDGALAMAMPALLRLLIWGILAGWLTMIVYRLFSDQEKISRLKTRQKNQQKNIAEFDGEFAQLLPLIRNTLALGIRQLGLSLGPALIATVPVLFIVVWVAGEFGHVSPVAGSEILLRVEPVSADIHWSSTAEVKTSEDGWLINWPAFGQTLTMMEGTKEENQLLLTLPMDEDIPIIHKKRWWNVLMANPLGYLPKDGETDVVHIALPERVIIASGPGWMRGWLFSFFVSFLLSSFAFKFLLRLN